MRYRKSFAAAGGIVEGREFVDLSQVSRPALIVVDMQTIFIDDDGKMQIAGAKGIVPRINELVELQRVFGYPIVWVQTDYTPPMGGLALRKWKVLAAGALQRGKPGYELCDGISKPREGEYLLTKYTFDAFTGTQLDLMLRADGVDAVLVCGVSTEGCCDSTYRSAFFRGYPPVMVGDATASGAGEEFKALYLEFQAATFGRVMTVAEVREELTNAEAGSDGRG